MSADAAAVCFDEYYNCVALSQGTTSVVPQTPQT
jgi:hypothetical protein